MIKIKVKNNSVKMSIEGDTRTSVYESVQVLHNVGQFLCQELTDTEKPTNKDIVEMLLNMLPLINEMNIKRTERKDD